MLQCHGIKQSLQSALQHMEGRQAILFFTLCQLPQHRGREAELVNNLHPKGSRGDWFFTMAEKGYNTEGGCDGCYWYWVQPFFTWACIIVSSPCNMCRTFLSALCSFILKQSAHILLGILSWLPKLIWVGIGDAADLVPILSWFVFSLRPRLEVFSWVLGPYEAEGRAHLPTFLVESGTAPPPLLAATSSSLPCWVQ